MKLFDGLARRDLLLGLLAASPLVAFPFSRSYNLFYLLIIAVGLAIRETRASLRHQRGVLLAGAAVGVPMLLTIAVVGLGQDAVEGLWLEKVALVAVATLLGAAVAGLVSGHDVRRVAAMVITLTVALWVVDGLVQLLIGRDLFGIPLTDGTGRVRAFFSKATRYGYFLAFLVVPAVFWLWSRPGKRLWAHLLVVASGAVVFAAGSRYAMVGYGCFVGVYVLLTARTLPPRPRFVLLLGAPVLVAMLATLMFLFNPSFQSRVKQTAVVLEELDRDSVNYALSQRLEVWEPALEMISERWIAGYGPSEFERQVTDRLDADSPFLPENFRIMHAHQVSLEILLGTGLVGFVAFLAWYIWLMYYLWRRRATAAFGWGCLLAYLLLWIPFGSQKDFYGSEQILVSFYLLGLGFGFVEQGDEPPGGDAGVDRGV